MRLDDAKIVLLQLHLRVGNKAVDARSTGFVVVTVPVDHRRGARRRRYRAAYDALDVAVDGAHLRQWHSSGVVAPSAIAFGAAKVELSACIPALAIQTCERHFGAAEHVCARTR